MKMSFAKEECEIRAFDDSNSIKDFMVALFFRMFKCDNSTPFETEEEKVSWLPETSARSLY
jgi:hypothetical protein